MSAIGSEVPQSHFFDLVKQEPIVIVLLLKPSVIKAECLNP